MAAAATLVFAPPERADAASTERATIVVNEVGIASSVSNADSFFELRNATAAPIDLTGWSVYRCDERGLRAKIGRPEVSLDGVVLAPGEIFLATQMSARIAPTEVDARFSQVYSQSGVGLVLVDADGTTVDAVAMYPNQPWPTQSECASTPNLPAILAAALDESWQRTDTGEWVRAAATAGGPNASSPPPIGTRAVRIDELAAAGPEGSADDFVELRNTGTRDIDISGWRLYRCTATGAMTPESLQIEFARDQILAAGERLLIAGPGYVGVLEPVARTRTSLADAVSGVALVTADGRREDGVSLSEHADTACQTGDGKLGSALDYRAAQSWQRTDDGEFVVATRTPGRENALLTDAAAASDAVPPEVQISEFATDPVITPTPSDVDRSNFVELANFSTTTHDIGGWRVYACGRDGFLSRDPLAAIPSGTTLSPGATWLAALEGTPAAASADATFSAPFDFQGAGVWIEDAGGNRRDGVGAFHVNEMDRSVDTPSACTSGLALPVFAVDRVRGETYQRSQQTGDNMDDFTAATATPGLFDQPEPAQLETRAHVAASSLALEPRQAAAISSAHSATAIGTPVRILEAYAGRSTKGPLDVRVGTGERAVTSLTAEALAARDDGYDFPYVRFAVAVDGAPTTVHWSGEVLGRSELRLSVWSDAAGGWREVDSASGHVSGLVEQPARTALQLSGAIRPEDAAAGAAWLLIQVVPRSGEGLTASEDLGHPSDYDFAVTHLTDTQYLTEAYPEVYADMVGWVVGSAAQRKIAFATHTGDLIQNWVDPDQPEDRARYEFEIASRMQSVLDDAGIPNSVLPGNHDSKRGITSDLFNEYFGPARYAGTPWYAGSIAPGDNTANFSTFTAGGAPMLMLSLPYAYGEREISWAVDVVTAHPDANVIVSTHEHLTPKGVELPAGRSTSSRWVSRAGQLWDRVIAPHRNVVLVLSGHFHGLGGIVTENAGGIPGHTVLEALADYQEFRTHTGERATGFARLLQFDLGGGRVSVDALSPTLGAMSSFPYDYEQFVKDNGKDATPSNDRPWRVIDQGLQNRYTAEDDHFTVDLALQYPKAIMTAEIALVR
jgi:hypothetical protein